MLGQLGSLTDQERLRKLAEFLPSFESRNPSGEETHHFYKATYDLGFVNRDFDWPSWIKTKEADDLWYGRKVSEASVEDLEHLLTALIRQDRFVDGLLDEAIQSGLVAQVLSRAKQLAEGA